MKKLLISFLGTLLTVFVLISAAAWSMPEPDNFTYSSGTSASAWALENRNFDGCLYRIENGSISAVYRRSFFGAQGEEKLLLVSSGTKTPLVVESRGKETKYYLLRTAGSGFAEVCQLAVAAKDTPLDYREEIGRTYLTTLTPAGGVVLYSTDEPENGKWSVELAVDPPESGSITDARYRDGVLRLLYNNGNALNVTATSRETTTDTSVFQKPESTGLRVRFAVRLGCKAFLLTFALLCILALFLPLIIAKLAGSNARHLSTELFWAVLALYISFACILCLVALIYAPRDAWVGLIPALSAALGLTAVCVGVSAWTIYNRYAETPLRELAKQMSSIAEGQKTLPQPLDRRDELGSISRALQELSISLSIRDYELRSTIQSFHRFVPRGLETLLDRASISEVSLGDSRKIEGCVGIFTICNRGELRERLGDDDYVSFVNRSAVIMEDTLLAHDAYLLSNGYDMAGNRIYFPNTEDGGVAAALDLLGAAAEEHEHAPNFCVLLHKTSFLYGIAGSADNFFPYLSSAELEFLNSYADRLYAAGSRVVVTDADYEQASRNHALRYIGFIVSPDGQTSLKLYEVLDAYSDLERNRRTGYDPRFQEAIGLFYKSDFYLARNIFSDILRVCPTDGIARWYLFACEYFFQSGSDEASFQLFGTDDQH